MKRIIITAFLLFGCAPTPDRIDNACEALISEAISQTGGDLSRKMILTLHGVKIDGLSVGDWEIVVQKR